MKELAQMFIPNAIAVLGASRDSKKIGSIVVRNLKDSGYKGVIYPINPHASKIQGLTCYKNINLLPQSPDLAIIALPAALVLESLKEINEKEVKNVVIFTAGFKEIGEQGKDLEEKLIKFALENNINVLGPNCLGFANTTTPVNATFGKVTQNSGNLRFVSQSGAVAAAIFDWAEHTKLGFSEFVTLGNKAVLNENDILEYWAQNVSENLSPIGMYLESISNGKDFLKITKELSLKHPLFVLKPGKSQGAKKAMQSHTGSIAGEDYVLETAFKQAGIIRCHDIQDMFDMSMALSWLPMPKGPNIAIVSNAGGPAVISADTVEEFGLKLAEISNETKEILATHMPRAASFLNPIDVLGDALADRYMYALETVLNENTVDSTLVILTPQVMTQIKETAEVISKLSKKYNKPVVCAFIGGTQVAEGEKILNKNQIPSFRFPERAIKVISNMWNWQDWSTRNNSILYATDILPMSSGNYEKAMVIVNKALDKKNEALDINESNTLLKIANITIPQTKHIKSAEEGIGFAQQHGYPVVLKISSSKLLHKKDVGGVITNIKSYEELQEAFNAISKTSKGEDIVIQKQIEKGIELIVGVKKDVNFGNVLMFGAGGTLAELISDRNLHLLPITTEDIAQLVKNSKIAKVLDGFRGDKPYKLDRLYALISDLCLLADSIDNITEIEINPVIITHNEVYAVDGKVLISKQ